MRAICNALVMLLLLSGPADGATFNERWGGLIVKSAPHRVAHHHIVRQRDWHRYGVEGWLELKACEANAVKVRAEQIGWHSRRARYGGRSWFGIRKQHAGGKRLGVAIDELYMVAGCYAQELSEEGLDCGRALFMGGGGPPCWQWRKAHGLLIGKIVVR
jgi:hypothetical protein